MALTRKLLQGMGIEDRQVDTIIEAHAETVTALKAERDQYKEQADKLPDLQKQLEEAKATAKDQSGWQKKYEEEHKAFEDFKTQTESEKTQAAKASAYRDMLEKAGIDPKRIKSILKLTDLSEVEMEDGKLKDADKLEETAKSEWADFIVKTRTEGSKPETPPEGGKVPEGADPKLAERMQARYERQYGKSEAEE